MISQLFLLAAASLAVSASAAADPAERVEVLKPRYAYAGGGWALAVADTCIGGTYDVGENNCCPDELQLDTEGGAAWGCCPPNENCLDAIQATPFCADSSWVLWNSSTSSWAPYAFFCCLPGQQGSNNINCESGDTVLAATLQAQSIGQPVPVGAAGYTATYTVSGVTITPTGASEATGTITSVIVKTTVSAGKTVTVKTTASGIVGSLESLASSFVHSDAAAVRPLDFSGLKMFAVWFTVVAAMTYGAFAVRAF